MLSLRLAQSLLIISVGTTLKHFLHCLLLSTDLHRDVCKVKVLLTNLDKDELRELFLELGLFDATVQNNYSGSVREYAHDLIRAWILRKDGVLESEKYRGGATWKNLKKALIVQNHIGIAGKIT